MIKLPSALRFTHADQESEFLHHDCIENLRWSKFCYASGALLWAAFGLLDIIVAPEVVAHLAVLRYLVGLPVLVLAFIATFRTPWQTRLKEIGLAVTLVCGASIVAMVNLLPTTSTHGYFVGLILVLIYAFSFGQLTFRYAVIAGVLLSGMFVIIELVRFRFPPDVIASKSAFLFASVYIGLFSCGILEHHRRNAFVFASDMRRANEKLSLLAEALHRESTHDELTGLLNRRQLYPLFGELIARLMNGKGPSSVMLIDVDNFKKVNDFAGHCNGDKVLKEIADMLRSFKKISNHVFRIGGDEFVIFFPGVSLSDCWNFVEDVASSFDKWKDTNLTARAARLGLSVGLAEVNSEHESLEEVLKTADQALYAAKRRRKGATR